MTHQTTVPGQRLSYTVDEACAVTGLNRNAIYRAITLGQINTFKSRSPAHGVDPRAA